MDLWNLVASIPVLGPYLPWIGAAGVICAGLATMMPAPKPGDSSIYTGAYSVVNFVGLNFGHAKNASAPTAPPTA